MPKTDVVQNRREADDHSIYYKMLLYSSFPTTAAKPYYNPKCACPCALRTQSNAHRSNHQQTNDAGHQEVLLDAEWLQLHPHARLLNAPCQVNVLLIQSLLRPDLLVFSMQCATMSNAMHNWNTLASSVQRKGYLHDSRRMFIAAKCCFNQTV